MASELSVRRQRGELLANLIFRLDQTAKSMALKKMPMELYILVGIPLLIALPAYTIQLAIGAAHRFSLGSESFFDHFPLLAYL